MGRAARDLTGQVFGRLTAIEETGRTEKGRVLWRCQCACGGEHIVLSGSLTRGLTKSCGCRNKPISSKREGANTPKRSKEYQAWASMINRCHNENSPWYKHYGGRGVRVCERWLYTPVWFLQDMGPAPSSRHSLDRINNDGDYEPSNCRWALPTEQSRNRRTNRIISFCGVKATATDWAEALGLTPNTIKQRLKRGMPDVAALVA